MDAKTQYNTLAEQYGTYGDLPTSRLEAELVRIALGDCTGLKILDLGGGTGIYARQAVAAGAARVDVADISDGMIQVGKDSTSQDTDTRIFWHVADASKPLAEQDVELLAPGSYDLVMANWLFDNARSIEALQVMWENVAASLRPGGRFLGIRVLNPGIQEEYVRVGKYGCRYDGIKAMPGGLTCTVVLLTDPPCSFTGTMLDDSCQMLNEIPQKLGIAGFRLVPPEETDVVKENPEHWADYLRAPVCGVATAVKM